MLTSRCWRISFVSLLLSSAYWLLHTSFMMRSMQYTQGFYYSSVWLCSVSSRQSLTLLPLCHVYPTCSPLPWLHPQAPGPPPFSPQPLSLISLMHGLLYINPPLLKRRISILLGRGWLRWDQSASGLSACRKLADLRRQTQPFHF